MFIIYQTLFNGQSMYCKVIIVSFDCVLFSFYLFSIVDVSLKNYKIRLGRKAAAIISGMNSCVYPCVSALRHKI